MRKKATLAATIALVALSLIALAAACGAGGGDSDEVASLDGSDTGTNSGNTNSSKQDPGEAGLAFAKCMREHGIDFPDPDANGGFVITPEITGDQAKFQKAEKACGGSLRGAPGGATPPDELSDENRAALQDAFLKFARCMREQGIEIPDPNSRGRGGGFAFELPRNLKPDDPDFKNAQKACQPILEAATRSAGLPTPGGGS